MRTLLLISISYLIIALNSNAEITLPYLLSDNMVIQRNVPVKIWGWANPGEKVTVEFNNQKKKVTTGKDGEWLVTLEKMTAGGPSEMTINGKNEIKLKNILIGDVWVCSGQSNMEWPLENTIGASETISQSKNSNIRLFTVQNKISNVPLGNVSETSWQVCNPATVASFSAVGYYFGKKVNENENIPVGLISSNWGGTIVETWTDLETMYQFPDYKEKLEEFKKADFSRLSVNIDEMQKVWEKNMATKDLGILENWQMTKTNYASWKTMIVPSVWESVIPDVDGVVWFQTEFEISADEAKQDVTLSLGAIDDNEKTYVNGKLVGETIGYTKFRKYTIPADVLKAGKNIITVRVLDNGWGGGINGKDDEIFVKTPAQKIELAGDWHYKIGLSEKAPRMVMNPNAHPTLLYNGMINPLINYGIAGVIWYQGESNSGNAFEYRNLLAAMIKNWREKWGLGDFPFIQVQLANYISNEAEDWPTLRESQAKVCNMLPNVGMATAIDIGNPNDIHPRNKKDVGYRLANAAEKLAYGKDVIASGPQYKSHKVDGTKIIVAFDNCGDGLKVDNKYGYVNAFEIAGEDGKYEWARGYISGNTVVLTSDKVAKPVSVRYAWDTNPEDVNLYNSVKLPAEPFRAE